MQAKRYPAEEERVNIASHMLGLLLSLIALPLLVWRAQQHGGVMTVLSFGIFGLSLIILYTASTLYHRSSDPVRRNRLRVFDHASIYVLIAGTYTPFSLLTLQGRTGWTVFIASWSMATTGIILKLFFTGKFTRLSTAMYVLMGWIIVFAIKPLVASLPAAGLAWLFAGGLAYTLGATLYGIGRIRFNHAIFHVLVLIGSACHFIAVYCYVLT